MDLPFIGLICYSISELIHKGVVCMNNVDDKLNYIENHFIDKMADNMNAFGISQTVGRVMGIIYMNRDAMTLDDLSEATGMSKMRMSQVVREMIELNIAERIFKKGSRKDLHKVETDYYQTFISLFVSNWQKAVQRSKLFEREVTTELENLISEDEINENQEHELNLLIKELKMWTEYYDWIQRVIHHFESGEIFKHVPKEIPKEQINE